MIQIIELNKTGSEHQVVNHCLGEILGDIAQDKGTHATFITSASHYQQLRLNHTNISFIEMPVVRPVDGDKIVWAKKFLYEIFYTAKALLRGAKRTERLNFFLSMSPIVLGCLLFLESLFFKKSKIVVTLHGELQYLRPNFSEKGIEKFFGKLLRWGLTRRKSKISFLIFGNTILASLKQYVDIDVNKFIVVEHPYHFPNNIKNDHNPSKKINFGHIGVASLQKRSDVFLELSKAYEYNDESTFTMIGRNLLGAIPINNNLRLVGNDKFLDRAEFEREVKELHWAVYLYEDKNYEMVASGAVFDAISYNIPIICIENRYFRQVFQQYSIGVMVNSFEELRNEILKIISGNVSSQTYQFYIAEIERFKSENSIQNIQKKLSSILSAKDLLT